MPFARIGIFQFKPGTIDKTIRLAENELLPAFEKTPGFLSYEVVKGTNGTTGVSIATWQTLDQARTGVGIADKWTAENQKDVMLSRDVFVGEVAFDVDSLAAQYGARPGVPVVEAILAVVGTKDFDSLSELAEPDAKVFNVAWGVEQPIKDYIKNWLTGFPDGQVEATQFIESGDHVLAEYIGRGTHTGTLQTPAGPLTPTGTRVEIHFAEIYRLKNGRVAGTRVYFNAASLMRQLGFRPDMTTPPAKAPERPEMRH